jgi:hypothetical protein
MNVPNFIIFESVLPNPSVSIDGTRSCGDDLAVRVDLAPYGSFAASLEPAARPNYFDGKLLTARDLTDEQTSGNSTSPTGTGDLADWQDNYGTGGIAASVDGGFDLLLGDGSVRDISARDAAFLAYDQGFLGGVTVAAGDSSEPRDAVVFAGDRYDPLLEQGIGGIAIAVADIEGKGPHMLMTAGFML